MNDMRGVIVPKSDQINADDLLAEPMTITIREVSIRPGTEQPVSIHFDGDNGKPYKPCKSMSRVLVSAWGADAKAYVGRSLTLYCDPKVKWGGMEVGGIRISHMSNIEREILMALTATKGKRAPFIVKPLAMNPTPPKLESAAPKKSGTEDVFILINSDGEDMEFTRPSEYLSAWESEQGKFSSLETFAANNMPHFQGWQVNLIQRPKTPNIEKAIKAFGDAFARYEKRLGMVAR